MVDVAVVDAAMRLFAVKLPLKNPAPATSRRFEGVDEPMPRSPFCKRASKDAFDDEAMTNGLVPTVPLMPRDANDVVEPIVVLPSPVTVCEFPVIAPPKVNAGVLVPQKGTPKELVSRNAEVEAVVSPVPPFATARTPDEIFDAFKLLNPEPFPVIVPVALMFAAVRFPAKYPFPFTSSAFDGVVVPMPSFVPVLRYVFAPELVK
jgi:hypothetical protein